MSEYLARVWRADLFDGEPLTEIRLGGFADEAEAKEHAAFMLAVQGYKRDAYVWTVGLAR